MNRLLAIVFVLLLVASAVVIVATTADLPPEVASHFGAQGQPNGWQSLAGYRTWILATAIGLPCASVAAMVWLPRWFPRLSKLPNREYWLAPERRAATFAALVSFAFAVGIVEIGFALGIHFTIVAANVLSPPRMPNEILVPVGVVFIVAIVALVIAYRLRFRVRRRA
jgi:MFS family permease